MESAKLVKATGEPLRALQELENSMRLSGLMEDPDTIDLTADNDAELKRMKAKASEHPFNIAFQSGLCSRCPRLTSYGHAG